MSVKKKMSEVEVLPIEDQVVQAKQEFPTFKSKGKNSFTIRYPDVPEFQFNIKLKSNFPNSAPTIFQQSGEQVVMSVVAYWRPEFTMSQILTHLHLYARALSKNRNISLSPTSSPKSLSPKGSSPSKYTASISFSSPKKKEEDEITEAEIAEEEEETEEEDSEIGEVISFEAYEEKIRALKDKFKKKQMITSEYINEYNNLKKMKDNFIKKSE